MHAVVSPGRRRRSPAGAWFARPAGALCCALLAVPACGPRAGGEATAAPPPGESAPPDRCEAAWAADGSFEVLNQERIGELHFGMSADEVRATLGEPARASEPEKWGATGQFHSSWHYPDAGLAIGIAADTPDGPARVDQISVREGATQTTRFGIGIGSTRQEVERAYGDCRDPDHPWDEDAETLIAGSIYGGVIFVLADGRVTSIFVGAGAE